MIRCSRDEDEAFGRMCRWLMASRLTMHSPRRGAPYLQKKAGKPHPYAALTPAEDDKAQSEVGG